MSRRVPSFSTTLAAARKRALMSKPKEVPLEESSVQKICQVCSQDVEPVLSLGYLPPPNDMPAVGAARKAQVYLPTDLVHCPHCSLVQLGFVPPREVSFPYHYPYTSGATPALRRNFEALAAECMRYVKPHELVVDIGSNDGTLLSCFPSTVKRLGIEPTIAADLADAAGIPTARRFFDSRTVRELVGEHGEAQLITCTNCFAHMPDIHDVMRGINQLLSPTGMFVSESHYLPDLLRRVQYDTIYAEHLRYYSLRSLDNLFAMHGFEIYKYQFISTHGGSIRVFAGRGNGRLAREAEPENETLDQRLKRFAKDVHVSRFKLWSRIAFHRKMGHAVVGIGAPSRGSTVISYCGFDSSVLSYVCEQSNSHKIGRLMPGTDIPVVDEARLYKEQPSAAILFSWHLADELIPKLRVNGYRGEIILPCSCEVDHVETAVA